MLNNHRYDFHEPTFAFKIIYIKNRRKIRKEAKKKEGKGVRKKGEGRKKGGKKEGRELHVESGSRAKAV